MLMCQVAVIQSAKPLLQLLDLISDSVYRPGWRDIFLYVIIGFWQEVMDEFNLWINKMQQDDR